MLLNCLKGKREKVQEQCTPKQHQIISLPFNTPHIPIDKIKVGHTLFRPIALIKSVLLLANFALMYPLQYLYACSKTLCPLFLENLGLALLITIVLLLTKLKLLCHLHFFVVEHLSVHCTVYTFWPIIHIYNCPATGQFYMVISFTVSCNIRILVVKLQNLLMVCNKFRSSLTI